jgi:putative ABC transport system permease protein
MLSAIRIATRSYGFVGLFGLILAAVGLGGMTAHSVVSRYHEIGIRMALGAGRGRVLRLVMREGAALISVGLVIGMSGGWAGSRALATFSSTVGQLSTTSATDPMVILGAPLLLATLALAACYLPARRASTVDPAIVLRGE